MEVRTIPVFRGWCALLLRDGFLNVRGFDQAALGNQLYFLLESVVPAGRSQFLFLPLAVYVLAV